MLIAELFEDIQKTVVVMPGGFHPFHAGHLSLYQSALRAFPDADVFVAATNDTKARPFPFDVKRQLAAIAGVPPERFVQVKSPFAPREITDHYDPATTRLVIVRSDKDRDSQPKPGGVKKDGSPAYLQPYSEDATAPMAQHGYIAYLPTVEFKAGQSGITSASQIRAAWPGSPEEAKRQIVTDLYPAASRNDELRSKIIGLLNNAIGESIREDFDGIAVDLEFIKGGLAQLNNHIDDYIEMITKAERIAVDKIAKHPEKKDKIQKKFEQFVEKLKKSIVKSDVELSLNQFRQSVATESKIRK